MRYNPILPQCSLSHNWGRQRNEYINIKINGLKIIWGWAFVVAFLAGGWVGVWFSWEQYQDSCWFCYNSDLAYCASGLIRDMRLAGIKRKVWAQKWSLPHICKYLLFGYEILYIQLYSLMKGNSLNCGLIKPIKLQLSYVSCVRGPLCSNAIRSSDTWASFFQTLADKDHLFSITHHIYSSEISFRDIDFWKDL